MFLMITLPASTSKSSHKLGVISSHVHCLKPPALAMDGGAKIEKVVAAVEAISFRRDVLWCCAGRWRAAIFAADARNRANTVLIIIAIPFIMKKAGRVRSFFVIGSFFMSLRLRHKAQRYDTTAQQIKYDGEK